MRRRFFNVGMLDYAILFALNAAEMVLELVASRLLSPYFGDSNFVWTAIIGIILLSGSLGNLIGGWLTKRKHVRLVAGVLLLLAATYLALTPLTAAPILSEVSTMETSVQFISVVASVIFFLIPSTILGITTPIIMKDRLDEDRDRGKESGRITAIIAIGSLVGTFAGGFWLIPTVGTKMIFVLLAIIVALCAFAFRPLGCKKSLKSIIILLAVGLITLVTVVAAIVKLNTDEQGRIISIDTEYERVMIEDLGPVRYYRMGGVAASATYLDEAQKYELVYEYLKKYDLAFDFLDAQKTLMIGGAAYQYPKYYIAHFPDKSMDVVEIDPMSTEIAKQYFFLDDLIQEYDLEQTGRLGLYNEDGRVFLEHSDDKYDAIFNDAFSGEVPPANLATTEAAWTIKQHLNSGGVYISNVLGAVNGDRGKFLRAEVRTLKKVFKNVYVVSVYRGTSPYRYANWMVVATDNDGRRPDDTVEVKLTDADPVLTDDYCPIDSLIATDYFDRDQD